MAAPHNQVFFPSGYSQLLSSWSRFPNAVPYAGGTGIMRGQGKQTLTLPSDILSLEKIEDLRKITRTEHYLEIGAMVKLNQIILLGKIVPEALRQCLRHIASPQLRNIATIGGNISYPLGRLDTSAPLTALDAQFELRSSQFSRWISATRFYSRSGPTALNPQELLTRIRIPREQWDNSVYKTFKSTKKSDGVLVFLVKTQKNILSDIRVVYKTDSILRDKSSESLLIGKHLPLNPKNADDFMEKWGIFLYGIEKIDEFSRKKLINFMDITIHSLIA
jgi:CO/xanthine dehydrogenase FAD-binding subunit